LPALLHLVDGLGLRAGDSLSVVDHRPGILLGRDILAHRAFELGRLMPNGVRHSA
jgi:hypothetical protein